MENIVLCGSMKVKDEIIKTGEKLKEMGYNPIYPEECFLSLPKEIASRKHFDRIIDSHNNIILIVNAKKNDIDNYIGANSLCEISFGFYFNKKVYLLYDMYDKYIDELEGWGVLPLKGNMTKILKRK